MSEKVTRPLLRYHGGKFTAAPWITSHYPEHRTYTEDYGGAASCLFHKRRSYSEIYNDLDDEVVNLFQICRNHGDKLIEALVYTPYSRMEFDLSWQATDDDLERARRMVVRAFMGFGSAAASGQKTGFRARNGFDSGASPATDWKNYPEALKAIINRLRGVTIEKRPALDVIKACDSTETLHYLDPPYVKDTRYKKQKTSCYKFEMSDDDHVEMCEEVLKLKGMVIISGYENEIYASLLKNFRKTTKNVKIEGDSQRTEVLWLSPNINSNQQISIYDQITSEHK